MGDGCKECQNENDLKIKSSFTSARTNIHKCRKMTSLVSVMPHHHFTIFSKTEHQKNYIDLKWMCEWVKLPPCLPTLQYLSQRPMLWFWWRGLLHEAPVRRQPRTFVPSTDSGPFYGTCDTTASHQKGKRRFNPCRRASFFLPQHSHSEGLTHTFLYAIVKILSGCTAGAPPLFTHKTERYSLWSAPVDLSPDASRAGEIFNALLWWSSRFTNRYSLKSLTFWCQVAVSQEPKEKANNLDVRVGY